MKIHLLTIGADIELFVQHKESGEIISAENFIQGTKDEPFVFDPTNPFYSTSKDNVLAEFTIPPAMTTEQWCAAIQRSVDYINSVIPKDYCTIAFPAFSLNDKWLQTEQAQIFGCEPDYNAYTGCKNIFPERKDPNLRSAGLHVHFGYTDCVPYNHEEYKSLEKIYIPDAERMEIIQACDLHLGVPAVLLEPPNKRKELYGKAGAFRPKPYGVEYRTLSNYYLQKTSLTEWVYNASKAAIQWLNDGNTIDACLGRCIEKTINRNDKEMAEILIQEFNLKVA